MLKWFKRTRLEPSRYSQNNEESHILRYFNTAVTGTFLDIGAFHPKTFSNTRALYERGFKGVFVEPSPSLLPAFEAEYGADPDIQIMPVCVGAETRAITFYDSGGDAISTTVAEETEKWRELYASQFTAIEREMITVAELVRRSRYKTFDFVNVDTEGNVLEILEQIDATALGVKLMCVEWNGNDGSRFEAYFKKHRLRMVVRNGENMIYGR
jgi:FkbM family methyltransferase